MDQSRGSGKLRENILKTFHVGGKGRNIVCCQTKVSLVWQQTIFQPLVGGNFHDITPISLKKSYGFYFYVGEIFAKKAISQKRENYPYPKMSTFTVFAKLWEDILT